MLDAQALDKTLTEAATEKTPLLILNSPSNPVGRMLAPNILAEIGSIMRKHQGLILSDEIYGEVAFDEAHRSVAHDYPEGTIISGGLSKWCGAGGWRLGYLAFPPNLHAVKNAICVAASETFTSVSAPIQYAAIEAYSANPNIQRYLSHSQRVLKHFMIHFHEVLSTYGISSPRPQGGFYLWASFQSHREQLKAHGIHDDETLCNRLLAELGIAMLPGQCFGQSPQDLTVRMSIVDFDGGAALEIARDSGDDATLAQQLDKYFPKLTAAPARIGQWLQHLATH